MYYDKNGNISSKGIRVITSKELDKEKGFKSKTVKHGEWNYYDENGNIKWIKKYKDDELDGELITYFNNGNINEIQKWKNGVLDGKVLIYNIDGDVIEEIEFVNGERKNQSSQFMNFIENENQNSMDQMLYCYICESQDHSHEDCPSVTGI